MSRNQCGSWTAEARDRLGLEILRLLSDDKFVRPRRVGGRSTGPVGRSGATPHSYVLRELAARGLVEARKLHALGCSVWSRPTGALTIRCECKGSISYRRTPVGRAAAGLDARAIAA